MTTTIELTKRREQVQRLLVRGLSSTEIARSLDPPIHERTVRKDIAWIRRHNVEWWMKYSTVKARMADYLKERVDALREVLREGWLVVYNARDDLRMKVAGLNVVLGAEKALNEVLGFSGVTMVDMEAQEKIALMRKELEELKRLAGIAKSNFIEP